MSEINFAWDANKNELNKKKHKISFEEAQTVFYDSDALALKIQNIPSMKIDLLS